LWTPACGRWVYFICLRFRSFTGTCCKAFSLETVSFQGKLCPCRLRI